MFKEINAEYTIHLAPAFVGRALAGVRDYLNLELLRFNDSFEGVPLAYNNIKFLDDKALIINDSPFMHFKVNCDFVVFAPRVGDTLVGVTNRQSSNHIGLLVHSLFNASISASKLPAGQYKFVADDKLMTSEHSEIPNDQENYSSIPLGRWYHSKSNSFLETGQELEFVVTEVVKSHGFIAVEGSLTNTDHKQWDS